MSDKFIHITKDGDNIHILDMDNNHLKNQVELLLKRIEDQLEKAENKEISDDEVFKSIDFLSVYYINALGLGIIGKPHEFRLNNIYDRLKKIRKLEFIDYNHYIHG